MSTKQALALRAKEIAAAAAKAEGETDLAVELTKIADQDYEVVPIGSVKLHPRNNNKGDIEAIRESMQANDFYGACIVQRKTKYILAGNHRWLVGKDEGLTEIPVIWLDVDDKTALRILIADNATARRAKVDHEATIKILRSIGAIKDPKLLKGTGITTADLKASQRIVELFEPGEEETWDNTYALNIVCDDEEHQERLYNELREQGLTIKVVVV